MRLAEDYFRICYGAFPFFTVLRAEICMWMECADIHKGTMSPVPGYTAGCDEGTFLVGPVGPVSCYCVTLARTSEFSQEPATTRPSFPAIWPPGYWWLSQINKRDKVHRIMVTKAYSPIPALWIHFGSLWETVAKIWAFQVCASEVWVKGRPAISVRLFVIVSLIKQDKPSIYGSTLER